jgi:uncharacterized membrane protein YozB (DUF420 family)
MILALCLGTLPYLSFRPDIMFLKLKQSAVQTGFYRPFFYCHIFGSAVILLTGFFQFTKLVYQNRTLHRLLGKIYVLGVLFFAAPGAYGMTVFIHRGRGVMLSFLLQNTLWIIFTLSAWMMIKKGEVNGHILMMRRSYSLAFAAVTLRFYIWMFTLLGNGVGFAHNYVILAVLSWVPNLLLIETLHYWKSRPSKSIPEPM